MFGEECKIWISSLCIILCAFCDFSLWLKRSHQCPVVKDGTLGGNMCLLRVRACTSGVCVRQDCISFALLFSDSFISLLCIKWSWDSAFAIATGYGMRDRRFGVRVPVGSRIFLFPCSLGRLWRPSSLLSNTYRGGRLFLRR
jgi:hypothetical protein